MIGMTITLYNTSSENNAIHKSLGTGSQYTGNIRDTGAVDVVRPVVLIESDIYNYNYAYIDDFERYYFITEITRERTGLTALHLVSDPLMTFQAAILALPAIAARVSGDNGSLFNSYIPDAQMKLQANDRTGHYHVHSFGWSGDYILITAG